MLSGQLLLIVVIICQIATLARINDWKMFGLCAVCSLALAIAVIFGNIPISSGMSRVEYAGAELFLAIFFSVKAGALYLGMSHIED